MRRPATVTRGEWKRALARQEKAMRMLANLHRTADRAKCRGKVLAQIEERILAEFTKMANDTMSNVTVIRVPSPRARRRDEMSRAPVNLLSSSKPKEEQDA